MRRTVALLISVMVCELPASRHALAGGPTAPAAPGQAERPWEQGSTADQRDHAHGIFSEANERFFKRDYGPAIELYEQALAVFDHPRIQLALARTLIRVGRTADAHPHLVSSLRFGAAPLDAEEYADALELQASLAKQLGQLVIRCKRLGGRLTLDGKPIQPCPGEQRQVVMPGRHEIVGMQAGYLTFTAEVVAEAGGETVQDVELHRLETATVRRRWSSWKPWTVVASGGVVVLSGVAFRLLAGHNLDVFAADVAMYCPIAGCAPGSPEFQTLKEMHVDALEARGKLEDRVAISLWVVGGAVLAPGVVGVWMNRERMVPGVERLVVTPLLSPSGIGIGIAAEL